MDQATIKQARELKFRFLHALFEATGGNLHSWETSDEIAKSLGISEAEASSLASQYDEEGLLEQKTMGGHLQILAKGRKFVEDWVAPPVQEAAPAGSHHYDLRGAKIDRSQLQLGSPGATQNVTQSEGISGEQLLALVVALREDILVKLKTQEQKEEMEAQLATLEAQAKLKKPSLKIAGEVVKWVFEVGAIALGDAIGPYLKAKLIALHLLPLLPIL